MTNKTLFIICCAIVFLGAAAGIYFYWQNTRPLTISSDQMTQSQTPPPSQAFNSSSNTPTPATSTPPAPAPAAPTASATCARDFSQSKLAGNANISIANREVAINVKDYGTITLGFYDQDAPNTVRNFLRLVDSGFYDCLTFHRVAAGFVIQGGDPTGTGGGGQTATGQALMDELNPNTPSYKNGYTAGILAMAESSAPNTGTSQFFITLADVNSQLQKNYPIFGHVISGMSVVAKIGEISTTPEGDGAPNTPVVMTSVKIIK